jgi:hypothetical protein
MYKIEATNEVICDPCAAVIADEQTGPDVPTGTGPQAPAGAVRVHGWAFGHELTCECCGEVEA